MACHDAREQSQRQSDRCSEGHGRTLRVDPPGPRIRCRRLTKRSLFRITFPILIMSQLTGSSRILTAYEIERGQRRLAGASHNSTRLGKRHATSEQLDEVARLEDDVRVERFPRRLDRHRSLDQVERRVQALCQGGGQLPLARHRSVSTAPDQFITTERPRGSPASRVPRRRAPRSREGRLRGTWGTGSRNCSPREMVCGSSGPRAARTAGSPSGQCRPCPRLSRDGFVSLSGARAGARGQTQS